MENKLEKKFGLVTAFAMVVGIVIGSGIFFKAVNVLKLTGGNMAQSLMVIGTVGLICIVCSCVFASMGAKYVKCNGIVDYAEAALGPKFGFIMGWFMAVLYYPIITAVLAYVSANYTCILLGFDSFGMMNQAIAFFYIFILFTINSLGPKLAGKLQVGMTVIKLVPLVLMGIVGTIVGLVNGNGIAIFSQTATAAPAGGGFFPAVCAFSFAYEGWIIATTINSELKNPKRDLPIALVAGAFFCTILYMLYVYSMSATMSADEILEAGSNLPRVAFSNLFHSNAAGTIIMVFIIISCLGATNGIMMACMRGLYCVAIRGEGPKPEVFSEVDETTGMPLKSCIVGGLLAAFWVFQTGIFFFNGPLVLGTTGNPAWLLAYEGDEIVVITQYALYIPIFLHIILKEKDFNVLKRFILPILGLASCGILCYSCWAAYKVQVFYYLVLFFAVMLAGVLFQRKNKAK